MKKMILSIDGMTCSACSSGLEKYLNKQKGIKHATVNLVLSIATIEYENLSKKELERMIRDAGFSSLGEFKGIETKETKKLEFISLILFGSFILFLMYLSMGPMLSLPEFPFLNSHHPVLFTTIMFFLTLLFLWYGFDILKSGFKNLCHKMPNMDTLVMFSVLFSFLYSVYGYYHIIMGLEATKLYFESTCMVIYFMKLGRYLEAISTEKTKDAIKKLVQITPQNAILKGNGKEKKISIDEVKQGDVLICKAGDKIAVDGCVKIGKSYVDESFITGESEPVLKLPDRKVIAGSICYDGYIEYSAEKIGRDSTISSIVTLVVEATNSKSKVQKLADQISGYFVPVILFIAVMTFTLQLLFGTPLEKSLLHMVTVLVVACPCALGLAVPLVAVVSNGLCAKKGLFIRNSEVLEKAKDIDTVLFDKTGTLTAGTLRIFKLYHDSSYSDHELLNLIGNIEKNSSHPIHTAFSVEQELEVTEFQTIPGIGISGMIGGKKYELGSDKILKKPCFKYQKEYEDLVTHGCTILYIVEDNQVIGLIGVKDTVREETKQKLEQFQKNHIQTMMLTGDHEKTAHIIAQELGIQKVIANVLPSEKAAYIKELIQNKRKVVMVGDGINDAPALATATIGVSIHDGTDIALDSSDVILMNNDISNIVDLITISKRAYQVIKQNLFWAFFYNLCMIPIAMGVLEPVGITMTPIFGSIAMIMSSLTVVLNSIRFGRMKK